jgi:glycosyltransferase involved in cell wall biosynthesis
MKILQVNTKDIGGGAEKIAFTLHQNYRDRGHQSWLAVGQKTLTDPEILFISNNDFRNPWSKFWNNLGNPLFPFAQENEIAAKLHGLLTRGIADPLLWWRRQLGQENFDFPATPHLLSLPPVKPDLIHCHNLHGEYFDLGALPHLSDQVPVFITLHDAWLLSGHCAHSFECDRWKTGCGKCPDLTIAPAIKRDTTAYNWQRKQEIYTNSKLYITTPSQWLMNQVKESILAPAIIESRVISNGIDLSVFRLGNQKKIRTKLNLSLETKIILFTANGIRDNPWKDYKTMQKAIAILAENLPSQNILFLALGENGPPEKIGNATIQFIPYVTDPHAVADYYRVADVYVHAARADTFPTTILEALACGIPVVATAVGGIPEQIEQNKTGFLIPLGDAVDMAQSIQLLLEDDNLRQQVSHQAAETAQCKFNAERMANDYLDWYQNILQSRKTKNDHLH